MCASRILKRLSPLACSITRATAPFLSVSVESAFTEPKDRIRGRGRLRANWHSLCVSWGPLRGARPSSGGREVAHCGEFAPEPGPEVGMGDRDQRLATLAQALSVQVDDAVFR